MKRVSFIAAVTCLLATPGVADTAPNAVAFIDGSIEQSLTGTPGNVADGRAAFINRKQGNCLACHMNNEIPEQSFHGEVGPPLDGAAGRWTEAELRGIVSNSKKMFEDTIMPAFYVDAGYTRPLKKFDGKTILSAQQVEDIVAYLMTLTEE